MIPGDRLGTGLLGMSFLSRLRDFSVAGARNAPRGLAGPLVVIQVHLPAVGMSRQGQAAG